MDAQGAVAGRRAQAAPDDPFALEEAGDALLEAGRHETRSDVRATEIKDVDPLRKLQASLREVERQRGNKDEALRIYSAALEESGETSWPNGGARASRIVPSDDDLPGLAACGHEAAKAVSGDLEASLRLSEHAAELNRSSEALKVLEAAADKARDRKDVRLKLADALLQAERPATRRPCFKLAARFRGHRCGLATGRSSGQSFKLGKETRRRPSRAGASLLPKAPTPAPSEPCGSIPRS
jgi:tetratricopeptide (TPR) repeat protein